MGLAVRESGEANALQHAIETEILPRLPALEDRRAALGGSMWRDAVLLAIAASVAAGLVGVAEAPAFVPFILIGAVGLGLWLHALRRGQWQATLIEAVMPVVCRCLGNTRYRHLGDPQELMEFEALGLIGTARYRTVLHRMEGRRGDTAFVAQHASLSRTRGRRGAATRVFHGLLIEIAVAQRPPCRIVIAPADGLATQIFAGVVRPLLPPAYERVATGDDAFDARFQVVVPPDGATAVDRVRAYLAPGFRAALLDIDSEEAGGAPARGRLRAAFEGDRFLLAVPRVRRAGIGRLAVEQAQPFLDPGGVLYLPNLETTVRQMAAEAATPHRIVDRLAG
jgi:hypothetical protein